MICMEWKWWVITIVMELDINHYFYFGSGAGAMELAGAEIAPMYKNIPIVGMMIEDQETFMRGNIFLEGLFDDDEE